MLGIRIAIVSCSEYKEKDPDNGRQAKAAKYGCHDLPRDINIVKKLLMLIYHQLQTAECNDAIRSLVLVKYSKPTKTKDKEA